MPPASRKQHEKILALKYKAYDLWVDGYSMREVALKVKMSKAWVHAAIKMIKVN
jgi:predicted DNA-binding protein YlxM (UPF0122 family)